MTFFPLIDILLYLALFFAPPDATHLTISGPDYAIELTRSATGWTSGPATLTTLDRQLIREENGRQETHSLTDHLPATLDPAWTSASKIPLSDATTLEKNPDGFVLRINDGDPAVRAYAVTYRRPAPSSPPAAATPRVFTINVLGSVNRPGAHPLPAGATVLDALAAAGGGSEFADLRKISVVRGPAGEVPAVTPHNAEDILRGQAPNAALLDRDTVFVPERFL